MSPEIFALLAPLPAKVKAVTVTDDNITFTIVISEYLCERSREAALNHARNVHAVQQDLRCTAFAGASDFDVCVHRVHLTFVRVSELSR